MSRKRISSFEKRYDSFLSEASNEEVVSISKELMDVIASQIRSINLNALTLLGISMASLILSISLVSDLSSSITGSTKNIIFLLRMTSIAFMCITSLISYLVIQRVMRSYSHSPLYWRHVRETATDESAYEQMDSIRNLDFTITSARNLNLTATLTLVMAGLFLGFSYIYQMMAASGYL